MESSTQRLNIGNILIDVFVIMTEATNKISSYWEDLGLLTHTSMAKYSIVEFDSINKEQTVALRRSFNSMAKVFDQFLDKERDYLNFLAKRVTVSPRCFFVKAHQTEVTSDMEQLYLIKKRMMECRDNLLVIGNLQNIQDVNIGNVYMPTEEEQISTLELSMALYGNI